MSKLAKKLQNLIECDPHDWPLSKDEQGFTLTYYSQKPWYLSLTGIFMFLIAIILFIYSIVILSVVNKTLKEGASLPDDFFFIQYHVRRGDLITLQEVFTYMLVISSVILFMFIWNMIPLSYKCLFFNQYTSIVAIILLLIISSWSFNSVGSKDFTDGSVKAMNITVIVISTVFIAIYIGIIVEEVMIARSIS